MWTFETYRFLFFSGALAWVIIAILGMLAIESAPCRSGIFISAFLGIIGVALGDFTIIPIAWAETFTGDPGYKPEHWNLGAILLANSILTALIFWALDSIINPKKKRPIDGPAKSWTTRMDLPPKNPGSRPADPESGSH